MLEDDESTEGFSTEQEETNTRRKRPRVILSKQQNFHDNFNNFADTGLVRFSQCHFKFPNTLNYFFLDE